MSDHFLNLKCKIVDASAQILPGAEKVLVNFEHLGLGADSEISGVLIQHNGLGESRDGGLAFQRLGHLQSLLAP